MITTLDAIITGAIAWAGHVILAETGRNITWLKWPFRFAIGSLCIAMMAKALERVGGDAATYIDLWRDGSLLAVFTAIIVWHRGRADKL